MLGVPTIFTDHANQLASTMNVNAGRLARRIAIVALAHTTWSTADEFAPTETENPTAARASSEEAADRESERLIVWVAEPVGSSFVERLHGQLSDLDVQLLPILPPRGAKDPNLQLAMLQQLAARRGVPIVVWLRPADTETDHVTLTVLDVEHKRLLVRELGDGQPSADGPTSATLEAGAIVTREAVSVFVEHSTLEGFFDVVAPPTMEFPPVPDASSPPRQVSPPVAAKPPPLTLTPVAKERSARSSFVPVLGGQWAVIADPLTPGLQHGPGILLGLRAGSLEAGVRAQATAPTRVPSPYGQFDVERLALSTWVGVRAPLWTDFDVGAQAHAGAVAHWRHLEPSPGVKPERNRWLVSPMFGVAGRARWTAGHASLVVTTGLDVVPRELSIGVNVDGEYEPQLTSGALQPWVASGLELDLASRSHSRISPGSGSNGTPP